MRVQIPAYTDRWMMGDRFGEVVSTSVQVLSKKRAAYLNKGEPLRSIATVKLDISGKTVKVLLDDCTVVS